MAIGGGVMGDVCAAVCANVLPLLQVETAALLALCGSAFRPAADAVLARYVKRTAAATEIQRAWREWHAVAGDALCTVRDTVSRVRQAWDAWHGWHEIGWLQGSAYRTDVSFRRDLILRVSFNVGARFPMIHFDLLVPPNRCIAMAEMEAPTGSGTGGTDEWRTFLYRTFDWRTVTDAELASVRIFHVACHCAFKEAGAHSPFPAHVAGCRRRL